MFVLLEHEQVDSAGQRAVHWDFLIEVPGQEKLATWRLAQNPIETAGPVGAERIADHRRVYLDYEGPLTGGRGQVRRLDRGSARAEYLAADELRAVLNGQYLRGAYEIVSQPACGLIFRPAGQT